MHRESFSWWNFRHSDTMIGNLHVILQRRNSEPPLLILNMTVQAFGRGMPLCFPQRHFHPHLNILAAVGNKLSTKVNIRVCSNITLDVLQELPGDLEEMQHSGLEGRCQTALSLPLSFWGVCASVLPEKLSVETIFPLSYDTCGLASVLRQKGLLLN